MILGPSRFQGNGRQVLRAQDADRHTLEIRFLSLDQGFFNQRPRWRKKLHRPPGDDKVLTLHCVATSRQVVENRLRTDREVARLSTICDEEIHVDSRDRLEVEGRRYRPTECVVLDDSSGLPRLSLARGWIWVPLHGHSDSIAWILPRLDPVPTRILVATVGLVANDFSNTSRSDVDAPRSLTTHRRPRP